jgi:hypothetical protein
MKNFGSILVAYMIGWGVFFAYFLTIARRTAALRKDLQRINSLIKTNESPAKEPVGRGK